MNPPCKNPLDAAKYREQYLSNLRLQASNDQRNLNANQIFKSTGQNPQQPLDMRGTTEKAQDFEGVKVALRMKLGTITDGVIASQIMGELSQSQIQFALDKWAIIADDMKKQYATGVPSSVFIAYLNKLIEKYQTAEGVQQGLQQNIGEAIIMSNIQLLYGLPRDQIWSIVKGALERAEKQFGLNLDTIKQNVNEQERLIPTQEDLKAFQGLPPNLQADIQTLLDEMFKSFPTTDDLGNSVGQINLGLANRDRRFTTNALQNLEQLTKVPQSSILQAREVRDIMSTYLLPAQAPQAVFQPLSREEWDALPKKKDKVDYLNLIFDEVPLLRGSFTKNGQEKTRVKGTRPIQPADFNIAQLNQLFESTEKDVDDYVYPLVGGSRSRSSSEGSGIHKMKGTGITKPYRQSIKHLIDKPIEKPKPYTPFGRYFINKHRLHDDIIALRSPSGNVVQGMPTEKVSSSLGHVVRTLVGGGLPSYEHINALSQDEKRKLSNICHKCRIDSPAVPNMKGEGQAEEDRFNILRGELISGNDNPKIARELKVLLLKFMNEGRVPRQQANEILHELLTLGL